MSKQSVTNTARGPRGFNVFSGPANKQSGERPVEIVVLNPGETRKDLELVDADHPAFKGMIDNHELVLGEAKEESPEDLEERQAEAFRNNPIDRMNRESAEAAVRTPGLATPPPAAPREQPRGHASEKSGRK